MEVKHDVTQQAVNFKPPELKEKRAIDPSTRLVAQGAQIHQ